jgi:hypothetical protein
MLKRTDGKTPQLKSQDVKLGTLLDVKLCVKAVYTKVTVKSWTMSVFTGKVRYETYQCVWSVATQTEFVNHLVTDILHKIHF